MGIKSLVDMMAKVFTFLLPPVAIPMILGLVTRRTSARGGLAGFAAGASLGAVAYVLSYLPGLDIAPEYRSWLGLASDYDKGLQFLRDVPYLTWITSVPTLVAAVGVSLLMPDSAKRRAEVDRFLDGLEGGPAAGPPEQVAGESEAASPAPDAVRIIGVATAAIGAILCLGVLVTGVASEAKTSLLVGAVMIAGGGLALPLSKMMRKS
jgi:hypothetical protein